jgi:hypothetical protein
VTLLRARGLAHSMGYGRPCSIISRQFGQSVSRLLSRYRRGIHWTSLVVLLPAVPTSQLSPTTIQMKGRV